VRIDKIDNAQRTAAKVAGWTYLVSFAIVVFANYVLFGPLIIPRNAVDTAHNIVAHQTQFRIALTWCRLTSSSMIDNRRYLKHSSSL
jgi:hypothetical protein